MPPVGGGVLDAERGERFGERVGKILDARLRIGSLSERPKPGVSKAKQ